MRLICLFFSLFLVTFLPLHGDPVISEFCASNQNGLRDENGDRPDWVEIYNPDATTADLTNWYLTDNSGEKTKWRFPAVTIAPGGRLVVFASGKDRRRGAALAHEFLAVCRWRIPRFDQGERDRGGLSVFADLPAAVRGYFLRSAIQYGSDDAGRGKCHGPVDGADLGGQSGRDLEGFGLFSFWLELGTHGARL